MIAEKGSEKMSRMHKIEERLSMLKSRKKHIVFLITEDRTILEAVFSEAADTVKGLAKDSVGGRIGELLQTVNSDTLYDFFIMNRLLKDAYEVFPLAEKRYIQEGSFSNTTEEDTNQINRWIGKEEPVFFMLTDFQIIKKSTASHFLKQFLAEAKREEEETGRFVVLFLVSPVMKLADGDGKLAEGLESSMEIIDVPGMDIEDIQEFLYREAYREEKGHLPSSQNTYRDWKKEVTQGDRLRIEEAARDFKGISKQGIQEILADLQTEYRSFFGRSKDSTGKKENWNKIRYRRKQCVTEYKKEEAKRDSTITMLEPDDSVAGLGSFKRWLEDIRTDLIFPEEALKYGSKAPKGVLLTGVPGSGKTQAAKMAASCLGGTQGNVPLVQFRMDNLLGGLVGDSEANFKRCRKRIEALAPCVVLMDEMEKTFEMNRNSSHEVKMNILTALLDWMQENDKPIFFFGTSNSVSGLRPELLRDGRFDMRFCVFMPACEELKEILKFHLKRANDYAGGNLLSSRFQYDELAQAFFDGIADYGEKNKKYMFYTGANIESLIAQTNRSLRKDKAQRPYMTELYLQKLMQTAQSEYSQPYGVTNMEDIARFWLSSYKNQYANAESINLFPFEAYRWEECRFDETKLPKRANAYDRYMFRCISAEIRKIHQEDKKEKDKSDKND